MFNAVPSPRPTTDGTSGQHVGGVVEMASPFDSRIVLALDPKAFDFHVDFAMDSPEFAVELVMEMAWRRGYCVDLGADPYEQTVMLDDMTMRTYLVPIEPVRDTPLEAILPDLNLTAYGPFSGFMEAVTA